MARVIRDPVQGYIELCPVQSCVLGAKAFQRLRHVRQNDVGCLTYPGLTHTRFEHSLGTSSLARRLFTATMEQDTTGSVSDQIVADAKASVDGISRWPAERILNAAEKILVLFGMIHDLGHLPFSHLTESALYGVEAGVYDNWNEAVDFGPLHEFAGYMLLRSRELRSALKKCGLTRFREVLEGVFKKENAAPPLSRTLKAFLSSDIDADRLDYLMRDGQAIGDEWGRFDLDRILLNLRLVPKGNQLRLVPRLQATSAIEALFTERFRQYQWVHFHHRTVYYGAAFSRLLHLRLEHSLQTAASISLASFHAKKYVTARGYFDDHCLWDQLVQRDVRGRIENGWVPLAESLRASLLFREARSVSLWKRAHDYNDFCDQVEPTLRSRAEQHWRTARGGETLPPEIAGRAFSEERLLTAFARCSAFKSNPLEFLRLEKDFVNDPHDDEVYVLLGKPHFTPFKTRYEQGVGDICDVFLWDESSGQFDALTKVSPIVKSLQTAWRRGIGLFAFAVDLRGGTLTEDRRNSIVGRGREMLKGGLERWFEHEPSVSALLGR